MYVIQREDKDTGKVKDRPSLSLTPVAYVYVYLYVLVYVYVDRNWLINKKHYVFDRSTQK